MAEKGFGVKEVNLIGASGTPTITSPNNLNLNANNVAISTNVSIGGTLTVTGNVSVGGTLTYEDVTNIDSVGLITARSGVVVGAGKSILVGAGVTISSSTRGDIQISGIATANSFDAKGGNVNVDIGSLNQGFYLNNSGSTHLGISWSSSGSQYSFRGNSGGNYPLVIDDFSSISLNPDSGACNLNYGGNNKLSTTNTGINVTGAITVNGSALSITPTDSDIQVAYTVTANGFSAYRFAGNGVVSTADNPDLYFIRGQKYRFINNSGGSHPFQIREASGGTAYSTGVTNNGAASGNIDFAPTYDSPAQLVYQCTSHGGMVGNIYLRDAAGNNTNVGVTTFANITANNINGNTDINVGTGEVDIYSTGSGDQLSLRLLNSDASAGNKIGIYFGPANNVAGAFIKGHAESDFTSAANRDAGLIFGTRLNANFLESMKISSEGYVTNPARPVFDVAKNDGAVSSTNAIVFNVENVNIGSHYDTSNGRFTAPVTGTYFLYYGGIKQNTNSLARIKLLKNGTGDYMNNDRELRIDTGANYGDNASMNVIVSLTAADYVQVYVTAGTVYGTDASYTHFGGYLLS